jgi:cellulose biosynthesis protein BcsQ
MILTFYSYKGGTGRSMALANVAALLASAGKRVLVVDFDLEAPGLSRYFDHLHPDLDDMPGMIELLLEAMDGNAEQVEWRNYVSRLKGGSLALSIITSGRQDGGYASRVLGFGWKEFFEFREGGSFIERLRRDWNEEFDFVLIDSRTGITDTGGVCTISLPDVIVAVFTANKQSVDGVIDVLRRAQAGRQSLAYDRSPAVILPLPSRIDTRTELEMALHWLDIFADRFAEFYHAWLPADITPRQIIEHTKLPHVSYFSFGEQLPVMTHGTSDPESLGFALNTVASLIAAELGNADEIVLGSPSVIIRNEVHQDTSWDFFISYTEVDHAWAEWIAWTLEEEGHRVLVQAWEFVPGVNWIQTMQNRLDGAVRTIAVLSESYLGSAFGAAEWQAAWAQDPTGAERKLLAVRVAPVERPGLLGSVAAVDLFGLSEEVAKRRLGEMARNVIAGRAKPMFAPQYPGPASRLVPVEPRFPGALPTIWKVPKRNPNFIGRDDDLRRLRNGLRHGRAVVCALRGMGGVGKSQLAIEYAHLEAGLYDLVWWVDAEAPATIPDQFASIAMELGLEPAREPERLQAQVHGALRKVAGWLLIFDNVDREEALRPWLPAVPLPTGVAGHVIVTTRRGGFRMLGEVIEVDILEPNEAIALMLARVPSLDRSMAAEIAVALGGLPLALDQAAAFLDSTKMPADAYLSLLKTKAEAVLDRGDVAARSRTLATVWTLSFERLEDENPSALQLMDICAYLAPEAIPLDLFTRHAEQLPAPLSGTTSDPLAFSEVIATLVDYSLVSRTPSGLQVHRIVQAALRARHNLGTMTEFPPVVTERGKSWPPLGLLTADSPDMIKGAPHNWPRWALLLPHVLAVTGYVETVALPSSGQAAEDTSRLLDGAATYLQVRARLHEAKPLMERALRIAEAAHGPDHPTVAVRLSNLAMILRDLGDPAGARPLLERALAVDESAYGPDHPAVATQLSNLALVLRDLGDPAGARPLLERALAVDESAYGPDHPAVATQLSNLALVLRDLGDPAGARPLLERALAIIGFVYGTEHPSALSVRAALAG